MVGEVQEPRLGDALQALYKAALEVTNSKEEACIYTKHILEQWLHESEKPVVCEQAA